VAQGGEEQNKSEEASPFKLAKAREKGSVARGHDLGFFSSLAAFLLFATVAGGMLIAKLVAVMRTDLSDFLSVSDPQAVSQVLSQNASTVVPGLVLLGITLLVIVLPVEIFQLRGLVFSGQPLKPDFNRLNPAQGFKRIFSVRTLKEAAKNILKFLIYTGLTLLAVKFVVAKSSLDAPDARQFLGLLSYAAFRLIALFAAAALALAAIDQIMARREFAKQMRMSRSELTREYKEREGEPRIKAKRKQLHGEFLKQTEGIGRLAGSDLLLVNPEHFAVALAYDAANMSAPTVRAKARNQLALAMRTEAARLAIPIIADPPLARALFKSTKSGSEIAPDQYAGVAGHYSVLRAGQMTRAKKP